MRTLLLAFLFTVATLPSVWAQSRSKSKDKNEQNNFVSKLWYGGGLNLGGGSFGGSNIFSVGLSPMVGYKILPVLSVGPRVSFAFSSLKERGFKAVSLLNVETGAFVRAKVFRGFFVQGELSNEWVQQPLGLGQKTTIERFNQYLGAGYNWGNGGFGQEIGVYYNFAVANDINSFQQPFNYRLAFTYRF